MALGVVDVDEKKKLKWLDIENVVSLEYQKNTLLNDLGLFKLKKKPALNDFVRRQYKTIKHRIFA